ncbi:MAG: hypothetical protein U0166_17810 [Acidobacteriota bacterium]
MPVFDHSYRHLEKPLEAPALRFLVIARMGIVEHLRRRWLDLLLIAAGIPFLLGLALLFVLSRFPEFVANWPEPVKLGPATFRIFFIIQTLFAVLVTVFAGAGLISGDLRTRALPLYLSRPVSRFDYALGKFLVIEFFLGLVTLLPSELLVFLRALTTGRADLLGSYPWLPVQVFLVSLLIMSVMGMLILALSSLSRSAWIPGLAFVIVFFFSAAFANLLRLMLRSHGPIVLSLGHNIRRVSTAILGQPADPGPHWIVSFVLLLGVMLVSAAILAARVRAVEVVTS